MSTRISQGTAMHAGHRHNARVRLVMALAACAALCLGIIPPAQAISKCVDAQGGVSYSDSLCSTRHAAQTESLATTKITRKQVDTLLATSDRVQRQLDVDGIMRLFAEDARIEIVVRVGHRTARQALRKPELAALMRKHRDEFSDYRSKRQIKLIDISPDGQQAETRSTLTENWRSGGQSFTMVSEEQALMELREGKLLVVQLYSIADSGPRGTK